ncbi:MAG TPA: hypothetical protein VK463_02310 [Desulfomonilaceae bacterium]|nr:hypothetical protein [Desulfomonilaceae bacterium]
MKNTKWALLAVLATTLAVAGFQTAHAELRFGPWVYYAPYYYPPDNQCLEFVSPMDFLPRYESPNPPVPSFDPGDNPPPGPLPRKVSLRDAARTHLQAGFSDMTGSVQSPGLTGASGYGFQDSQSLAGSQPASPAPPRPANRPMVSGQGTP